jgi:hypothetical protein
MADSTELNRRLSAIESNLMAMTGFQEETNQLLTQVIELLKELIDATKSRD